MSSHYEAPIRKPLVLGEKTYAEISNDIARPVETPPDRDWWIAFSISMVAFLWGLGCIATRAAMTKIDKLKQRKKNKNYTSIVVFAKKEKFKNLLVYDAINKIFNKNKILAPKLYKENYFKNYMFSEFSKQIFKAKILLLCKRLTGAP